MPALLPIFQKNLQKPFKNLPKYHIIVQIIILGEIHEQKMGILPSK